VLAHSCLYCLEDSEVFAHQLTEDSNGNVGGGHDEME